MTWRSKSNDTFSPLHTNTINQNSHAPTDIEAAKQTKILKINKASGEDGIVEEHFKAAGSNVVK